MFQKDVASLPLWQFDTLSRLPGLVHFVSGRGGGVSSGEVGTFNLSYRVTDPMENVRENRRRLAQALGITEDKLFFPAQTHSNHVVKVQPGTTQDEIKDMDALITNSKGLCISVMSADCVPILLYDPIKKAVGAVHAGWRGTVSKILTLTVQAMQQQYGTQPADLVAAIGPSICPEVYEVGEEVITAVEQAFGTKDSLVTRQNGPGKGNFNLWEANQIQLLALGVKPENIEVAAICTYQHSDEFFSARRSGNRAGRFSAGILLREG